MAFRLVSSGPIKNCEVALTPSKSISNRSLIIRALCKEPFEIDNLSTSTDTQVLLSALNSPNPELNVNDAGTAFRFLVSYLSIQSGSFLLTGSERMKQRPIGPLVDTLKKLGAYIEYSEQLGFPPLKIIGSKLEGGQVAIDSNLSSQFVSSLLMIGPVLKNGLTLELNGKQTSESYVDLTIEMMRYFGAQVQKEGNRIIVSPKTYHPKNYIVENDWSSASYWYSLCALNPGSQFILHGLKENSFQGDSIIASIMSSFGVKTKYESEKIIISSEYRKLSEAISEFEFDFTSYPDLVMTMAVLCAAKGVNGRFSGVGSLRIKESDRLQVLKSELGKCGVDVIIDDDKMEISSRALFKQPGVVETHNDHRIAMAFAPLATVLESVSFDSIDVVTKSYPEFWEQLSKTGLDFTS
jgi:3-phosphoshikimate 1-carboxyvinyltransferase